MNEAFSESAEFHQRPELDRNEPAKLFLYAKEKQRWIQRHVSDHRLREEIDYLANELERYVSESFDTLPELTITSSDVYYTKEVSGQGTRHAIESGPLPLDTDAELFGEHTINGVLFGFHRGTDQDLRAYVSLGEGIYQYMGGIYTPLLSVGVEKSVIQLTEYTVAEELQTLTTYIDEQLPTLSDDSQKLTRHYRDTLDSRQKSSVTKLHEGSIFLTKLAQDPDVASNTMDALMEMAKLQLHLYDPQDIQTQMHRVVISHSPVSGYKQKTGPTFFPEVEGIQLGMIGETVKKSLGLFFIYNDQAVEIPVEYITNIYRSVR